MAHGEFSRWLLRDEQKELFDALFACALTIVFLGLSALLLWPLGRALLSYRLAKGYWLFCIALYVVSIAVLLIQRLFRVDVETRSDAYLISNLIVGGFLQAGWSAFAALTVRGFNDGASAWVAAGLYFVGLLSCFVSVNIVSTWYGGGIYRMVNLILAHVAYAVFCLWAAGARAVYGWFFDLF